VVLFNDAFNTSDDIASKERSVVEKEFGKSWKKKAVA
jgi:hypothetical protein